MELLPPPRAFPVALAGCFLLAEPGLATGTPIAKGFLAGEARPRPRPRVLALAAAAGV